MGDALHLIGRNAQLQEVVGRATQDAKAEDAISRVLIRFSNKLDE